MTDSTTPRPLLCFRHAGPLIALALSAGGCGNFSAVDPPDASGSPLSIRDSREAHDLVERQLARYQRPVPPLEHTPRAAAVAVDTAPVIAPSVVEAFEQVGEVLLPRLTVRENAAEVRHANVSLPVRADGRVHLADDQAGVSVEIALLGARPVAAQVAKGYLVYPAAHESGADVLHRVSAIGTEDYLAFEQRPTSATVKYQIDLGPGAAGLRLVADTLEVMDASGAPRLRVSPPFLIAGDMSRHEAHLSVEGCAVDTSGAAPWGRAVTPPGATRCVVAIDWSSANVVYPALLDPSWGTTGSMALARRGAAIVKNPNTGVVYVMGGEQGLTPQGNWTDTSSVEQYSAGSWAAAPSMHFPRSWLAAVFITSNGRILACGGTFHTGDPINEEYYDGTNWVNVPRMNFIRTNHTATLLNNNKVLVVGGYGLDGGVFQSMPRVELFDPTNNTWTNGLPLVDRRNSHTATLLQNGNVLVAGGTMQGTNLATVEIYNTAGGNWTSAAAMSTARNDSAAVLLANGQVLLVGGRGPNGPNNWLASAERYNPGNNTWTPTAVPMFNFRSLHTAVALNNSTQVIVAGGSNLNGFPVPSEIYDQATDRFLIAKDLNQIRLYHMSILLNSGAVLIATGQIQGNNLYTTTAELFTGATNGSGCATGTDCQTGQCILGICCAQACPLPAGVAATSCPGGTTCAIAACNANLADCNGIYGDGCEANLLTNTSHCGGCNRGCSPSNVASLSCSGGQCNSSCNAGFGNCTQPAFPTGDNGCEANLNTDTANCGGCGRGCSGTGVAVLACASGTCSSTCNAGLGNCTQPAFPAADNGCETNVNSDTANCGGCGRGCNGANVASLACAGGACTSSCNAGFGNCTQPAFPTGDNGCEANLNTDTANCGGCGRGCSGANVASLACASGACTSSCNAGFGNCTQPAFPTGDNGCEANLDTDTANCGGCGRGCSGTGVAVLACASGTCSSTCNAGLGNCTQPAFPAADNGCETNVNTDTANCGGCGRGCSNANVASLACASGTCSSTCAASFANCSQPAFPTADNGCEADTRLNGNCGGCGVTCSATVCSTNATCDASGGNGVCKAENKALCDTPACAIAGDPNFGACANDPTYPWKDTDGDGYSDVQETQGYIDTNCNGLLDGGDFQFPTQTKHQFSAVTQTGTGIGRLLPTVTNPTLTLAATTVSVTIASTGALGAATFTYRIGGGAPSSPIVVRPVVDIAGNNRLIFYLNSFISGDVYNYSTSMAAPAPVADPATPNVYVQYDYMDFATPGAACTTDANCTSGQPNSVCHSGFCNHDHAPGDPLFRLVVDAYASRGMRLYIDPVHNAIPHATVLTFAKAGDSGPLANGPLALCAGANVVAGALTGEAVSFNDVKTRGTFGGPFPSNRRSVYRYSVIAHLNTCLTDDSQAQTGNCTQCPNDRATPSGFPTAGTSGTAELPGNDFIVSLAASFNNPLGSAPRNPFTEGGVFMHELGHTLGLHHAGDVPTPINSPNYLSIMNNKYVFSGIQDSGSPGSKLSVEANRHLDYSQHRLQTLSESSLVAADGTSPLSSGYTGIVRFVDGSGANGVGPESGLIDWDGQGSATSSVDLNEQNGASETMVGFADGVHPATGGTCVTSANCSPPLSTCDLVNHVCTGPCTTSADCRINAVRQQIHDLVDSTVDPHETCIAGSCNSMTLPFQCFSWSVTDASPPQEFKIHAEPSPTIAAANNDLYPSVNASVEVRRGCSTHWIALSGPGNVPVAIYGSQDVDATLIDILTLRLGGAPAVSTLLSDLNGDGRLDMTASFAMTAVHVPANATTIVLKGAFASSQVFQGSAAITLVPSAGPVITIHNDGTGFAQTIAGNLNNTWVAYSIASGVDSVVDRCGNTLVTNTAGNIIKLTADESTTGGIQILSNSTFQVKRKKNNGGDGRVYTLTFSETDSGGNATNSSYKIQVKAKLSDPNAIDSGQVECVGTCP